MLYGSGFGNKHKKTHPMIKKAKIFPEIILDRYTVYRIIESMTMIRDAIIKRMKELKLNPNRLSEMLKKEGIPRMTIYDFLTERDNWRDTRTEVASALMKVLGLTITEKGKVKHGKRNK